MTLKPLAALIPLLFLMACSDSNAGDYFENCKYGEPKAIFSPDIPEIKTHRFMIRQGEGVEEITFESGKELTIVQMGCDSIRQDFQFYLPGNFERGSTARWVERTVEEFNFLASLDSRYLVFSSWAQSIEAQEDTIKLAQSEEIQPGFFVKIDRILEPDHARLMVTLSESP